MCEGGGLVVLNPILSCKEKMSMLITLEPQGIFWIKLLLSAGNIVQPLVRKR